MEKVINSLKKLFSKTSFLQDQKQLILEILLYCSTLTTIISIISIFFSMYQHFSQDSLFNLQYLLLILLILITLIALMNLGKANISATVYMWLLLSVELYITWKFHISGIPLIILLFFGVLLSFLLVHPILGYINTIIVAFYLVSFDMYNKNAPTSPPIELSTTFNKSIDITLTFIVLLIIIALLTLYNREIVKSLRKTQAAEKELKQQRDQLEITVEKRTSELQKSQFEQISQLYKFAEFGKIASGLFHDLSNPLSVVSLNLEEVQIDQKNLTQSKLEELNVLIERAKAGAMTLEKFIKAARKQLQNQEVQERFSVVKIILEVVHILHYKAQKANVTLHFQPPTDDIVIYGNPLKFTQIVTNLVSNAIDSYENQPHKHSSVYIEAFTDSHTVTLRFKDYGKGIEKEVFPHIFDPLYTTKDMSKGTGIGLSIAKDIVERDFLGTITVHSEPKEGTEFTVKIPLS